MRPISRDHKGLLIALAIAAGYVTFVRPALAEPTDTITDVTIVAKGGRAKTPHVKRSGARPARRHYPKATPSYRAATSPAQQSELTIVDGMTCQTRRLEGPRADGASRTVRECFPVGYVTALND